jgi:PTS system nitrogen regulatory IIA component
VDRRPVHTVFALVCPTIKSHLALLSRLAFALQDAAFRQLLKARGSREEVLRSSSSTIVSASPRRISFCCRCRA